MDVGLKLLALPGQLAGFTASETNSQDRNQDLFWSVTFNGLGLSLLGPDAPSERLFQDVPGGKFLPFQDMPGKPLTATSRITGSFEYYASAVAVDSVPEPNSLLLFGTALIAMCGCVVSFRRV